MQQRFVIARLEHIGYDQETIRIFFERLRDGCIRKTIQSSRCDRRLIIIQLLFAGKSNDSLIGTMAVRQTLVHGMIVFNTAFNTAGNDHRTRLPTDLSLGNNLLMEVADHHIRFFGDGERLALDKRTQLFLRLLLVKQRIIFHRLFQSIEAVDRRIVFQHI